MDEFDGSYIFKMLKEGQQKIGEASGAKKKSWWNILQLSRVTGSR